MCMGKRSVRAWLLRGVWMHLLATWTTVCWGQGVRPSQPRRPSLPNNFLQWPFSPGEDWRVTWSYDADGAASPYHTPPSRGYPGIRYALDFQRVEGRDATIASSVRAAAAGVVRYAGPVPNGYGVVVEIDHGNGFVTRYAHLAEQSIPPGVTPGTNVVQGQIIGRAGNTGQSTGPHIHFEVRTIRNGVVEGTVPPVIQGESAFAGADYSRGIFRGPFRVANTTGVETASPIQEATMGPFRFRIPDGWKIVMHDTEGGITLGPGALGPARGITSFYRHPGLPNDTSTDGVSNQLLFPGRYLQQYHYINIARGHVMVAGKYQGAWCQGEWAKDRVGSGAISENVFFRAQGVLFVLASSYPRGDTEARNRFWSVVRSVTDAPESAQLTSQHPVLPPAPPVHADTVEPKLEPSDIQDVSEQLAEFFETTKEKAQLPEE